MILKNSEHHIPAGATAKRKTSASKWIELTLGVRRKKDLPDLSALELVVPAKRKYMTRDELAADYGSDPAAVQRIKDFAAKHHLVVSHSEPASARLHLGGTVADLSAAFGVTLFDYSHPQLGDFHARTGPISVPDAQLASDITGVFGFNTHRMVHRGRRAPRPLADTTAKTTKAAARPWFVPTELAPIYQFPAAVADLSKQCVALLEFGGGVDQADLAAYFTHIDVPLPKPTVIALNGVSTDPAADPDSTGEVMLDVEVVGALAGGAAIAVYFSTFDEKGLIDAIAAVVADTTNKPTVVSISWGWAENQPLQQGVLWSPAAMDHINHSFLAAAQIGCTVCVSTGDDGSEAQVQDGRAHVSFPATSPYVLAVGGTTLHVKTDATHGQTVTEVVWNDGAGSGGGGGISDYTARPPWQEGVVPASINPGAFVGRGVPDVSANADPDTGYLTRSGGKFGIVGGTSASAPLWASLIARINAAAGGKAGNFNALLYTTLGPAGVLRDIVKGNNDTGGNLDGQFAARIGWDAATGWGVPDGEKLKTALFP